MFVQPSPEEEVDLQSADRSPRRLVIVGKEAGEKREFSAFIIADTLCIDLPNDLPDVKPGVCHLLACYYTWDLAFLK